MLLMNHSNSEKYQGDLWFQPKAEHSSLHSLWRKNQKNSSLQKWAWHRCVLSAPFCRSCSLTLPCSANHLLLHCLLLVELADFSKHGSALNLVPSSPLSQPCIWPHTSGWPDNQEADKRRIGGGEENPKEESGTKIGQFAWESWMPGRQSTGSKLFGKDECHN